VIVGRQVLPWLAAEIAYGDYGAQRIEYRGRSFPIGPPLFSHQFLVHATRKVKTFGVDLVGTWPPEGPVYLSGSIGAYRAKTTRDEVNEIIGNSVFPSSTLYSSYKDTSNVARYSLGAGWRLNPSCALTLSYEHLGEIGSEFPMFTANATGKLSQSATWLGLTYRF